MQEAEIEMVGFHHAGHHDDDGHLDDAGHLDDDGHLDDAGLLDDDVQEKTGMHRFV